MISLPILYQYTKRQQVQQWQIFVDNNTFWTEEGIQGGKITTSLPTLCFGKNKGKKNETSDDEQALLEAKAKWQKKIDKGYNEVLSDEKKFFEPMLAHTYTDHNHKIDWKNDKVFVQPKLDGLRCISQNDTLMSRNGKPYLACPHLLQSSVILDGELYNHELKENFNKIVSLCKKQKPTQEELDESEKVVEHWVYDFPQMADKPFSERFEGLKQWYQSLGNSSGIRIVPTYQVSSEEEIKTWHSKFLGEGYEGTIVRVDAPYKNGRSDKLLKFKDFIDEEFKIVGAEEGEGGRTGTIGFFIMQHDKNPEQTFKSNIKGNFDYLKEIWKNKDSYIGSTATVKYFNRTPKQEDGTGDCPRFPYIIKLKREEYE